VSYIISVATLTSILLIAVLGTFMVTGLTGLFSMGQGAFLAIGAYTSSILVMKFNVPFYLAAILTIAVSIVISALIGFISLRFRQDYFALVTFGFGEALIAILNVAVGLTGGAVGLVGIPQNVKPWHVFLSLVLIVIFVAVLKRGDFGRKAKSIRDNEMTAEVLGIPVFRQKLKVFILGSTIMSYAGVLYGSYLMFVDPTMFGWMRSAEWIIIVFFGGRNSLTGALLSGALLFSMPEALRFAAEWRVIIYCVLIILIISFRPAGIMGNLEFSPAGIYKSIKKIFVKSGGTEV
jgi:branched-chain amino acid transport system permease protein